MVTIKLKYDVEQEYQTLIQKYQRQYSSMLHVFYQQLSKEVELQPEYSYLKSDSILKEKFKTLNNTDLMNDWFCRSAIGEAYQLLKSNKDEDGNDRANLDLQILAYAQYALDGVTVYARFDDVNVLAKKFVSEIRFGAQGSVGGMGYNTWLQINTGKGDKLDKVDICVPFELTYNF